MVSIADLTEAMAVTAAETETETEAGTEAETETPDEGRISFKWSLIKMNV